jgi:glutaminyl-peptide cyclotransferase
VSKVVIMNKKIKLSGLLLLGFLLFQCKNEQKTESETTAQNPETKQAISALGFDSDAAYTHIETQLGFGTRIPGSKGHKACGDWIVSEMESMGYEVLQQPFDAFSYKGEKRPARNIIASYNGTATKRIILAAHWDTREIADHDNKQKDQPIPGANDGGSGVAVLMEIARSISQAETKPAVGIDFIFFDAEDGGAPEDFKGNPINEYGGYLLGSDYWSKNPHKENYSAFYGILLDMVGAKNATFYKEQYSMQFAPSIVNKVWNAASAKGFSQYFINKTGGGITDDHLPVNLNRKIPMIDIIDTKLMPSQTFFDHWHTHNDNIEAIDKNTLKAVGETLLQVLYEEEGAI